jgi:hypothetical protein
MDSTTLLCTFCTEEMLQETLNKIVQSYSISFDTIYILEDVENPNSICCTYNVNTNEPLKTGEIPDSTISLHRKKSTNTLYTINALNLLVTELNGGSMDKNFKITWENYKNTILVTAYGKLKKIPTKLRAIIKVLEITG